MLKNLGLSDAAATYLAKGDRSQSQESTVVNTDPHIHSGHLPESTLGKQAASPTQNNPRA
jgi:hypothetical protein